MNFDLTEQFVRDFEELRRKVEPPPAPIGPPPELIEELDRFRTRVVELQALVANRDEEIRKGQAQVRELEDKARRVVNARDAELRQAQASLAWKEEELSQIQARSSDLSKKLESLRSANAAELDRKELVIQQLTDELVLRRKELTDALARRKTHRPNVDREEMARLWDARVVGLRARIVEEIESKLDTLASLPLRMRLAVFLFDVIALAIGLDMVQRSDPVWTQPDHRATLVVGALVIFSLRTFVSPGRLILGISPRRIGPDLVPVGGAGFMARFCCGILHYGPLIAAAHYVVTDPPTLEAIDRFLSWMTSPAVGPPLTSILNDLFWPTKPSFPVVVLAMTLAWWATLLLSLLISRWVHRSTPYFWNTTFVESLCHVGYQRFPWPREVFEPDE